MPAICPNDKPHQCPIGRVCYGRYKYCSPASENAEPCVSEAFLETTESRLKLCQNIIKGQNVSVRHGSCDMEADCWAEFKSMVLPSTTIAQSTPPSTTIAQSIPPSTAISQDDVDSWKYILSICVCAVLAILVLLIPYFRKRAKRKKHEKEQARMLVNNNDNPTVAINLNNSINESKLVNGNTRQQSTDSETGDTENTELMAHVRGGLIENGNIQNSADSGITPDSTAILIHTDSSTVSFSNRNSNDSSGSSSASFGRVHQEENQRRPSPGDINDDNHPAVRENRQQRGVHMPTSEPSGNARLVTSQTFYDHSDRE